MGPGSVGGRVRTRAAGLAVVVAVLGLPAALVGALHGSAFDLLFESVTFHLFVVTGIAACALGVALVAARSAGRTARNHLEPLAVGCLAVGVFMVGHGVTTPGVFGRPFGMWVARMPVLAITAFAVGLWLVHRRAGTRRTPRTMGRRLAVAAVAMVVPTVAVAVDPGLFGAPFPGEQVVRDVVAVGSGVLLLHAGLVHWRRWRLSGSALQLSLTLAAWLSTSALVSLQLGAMWRISWWDYHAFLLAGFGSAITTLVMASREHRTIDDLLDDAFDADPFAHIVSGYPEALRSLVAAVEAKDSYTHGHSARVAELSARLGLELGLSSEQLRGLARGAYLHDVGKIEVPDHILNKPGRLDEHERAAIERHPETGARMAARSPSLAETLDVIRHHHERFDGTGYPTGLAGQRIPFTARICAVADVWDALTFDRAYRDAMTREEALSHVVGGRGSHFDPVVVDALVRHLRAAGLVAALPVTSGTGAAVVAAAAEACHDHRDHDRAAGPAVPA